METQLAKKYKKLSLLYKYIKGHCYISGGCIKDVFDGKVPRDIDIYFMSEMDFKNVSEKYKWDQDFDKAYVTQNVEAYKEVSTGMIVELVKSCVCSPTSLFETSFDFYVDMFALICPGDEKDTDKFEVIYDSHFFEDLYTRKLTIANITSPLGTMSRVIKYSQYGYDIDPEEFREVTDAINELDPNDYIYDLKNINAYALVRKDRKDT